MEQDAFHVHTLHTNLGRLRVSSGCSDKVMQTAWLQADMCSLSSGGQKAEGRALLPAEAGREDPSLLFFFFNLLVAGAILVFLGL